MAETKKKQTDSVSFQQGITSYFRGVRAEWGKITWPERRQVVVETFIVIGVVFFFTVMVYVMDVGFKWLLSLITNR